MNGEQGAKKKENLERLDPPATESLIARFAETNQLDEALAAEDIGVLGIVASGGTGKSALISEWLERLDEASQPPQCIFAWRFSDPAQHGVASSNDFFVNALESQCLGQGGAGGDVSRAYPSGEKKADALWETYQAHKAVLVLDGIEELQFHGKGIESRGRFQDLAIKRLLTKAADHTGAQSGRLILVTSRESLTDLLGEGGREGPKGYQEMSLGNLAKEDGRRLLKELGVTGSDHDLEVASEDYGGHALTLVLCARMITETRPTHHITRRTELAITEGLSESEDAERIRTADILNYYEANAANDEEIALLRMMALFHRSMLDEERRILLEKAASTLGLDPLTEKQWEACHDRLERVGLLIPPSEVPRQRWDCHPLVREHYRDQLAEQPEPNAFAIRANQVLFEHFANLPQVKLPRTWDELIPLYRAVAHGCRGELFREALGLYRQRIMQGENVDHGANELGAIGEDAAALRMFFKPTTPELLDKVKDVLGLEDRAWLQARTAFCLTCLGRLGEAMEHRQTELAHCSGAVSIQAGDADRSMRALENSANAAAMLSELKLLVGEIGVAEDLALQSRDLADRGRDWRQKVQSRCRLGAVRHMQGRLDDAGGLFADAVELKRSADPTRPVICSDLGFLHRRFLLERPRPEDPVRLITDSDTALDCDQRHNAGSRWLIAIALDLLSKACATAKQSEMDGGLRVRARELFDEAEVELKNSGGLIYFPEYYLARADFDLHRKAGGEAAEHADQALRYASDFNLALYRVDANLIKARIFTQLHEYDLARKCLDDAESEAKRLGYGRHLESFQVLRNTLTQRP